MDVATKPASFGVYFLCNDPKIDWAYAMLASFREYNPTTPLTLIPYDERIEKLKGLRTEFAFDILESDSYDKLAQLTVPLCGRADRMMRKYASFTGVYDFFFYLDADIIVTSDLTPLAQKNISSGMDFVYFDADINMVYHAGPLRDEMISVYQTRGFNAGCWFSRRGLLEFSQFEALAKELEPSKQYLNSVTEQAFINYCLDKSRVKLALFSDLAPEYFPETWYQHVDPKQVNRQWIHGSGEHAGRLICMIHFAGQSDPGPAMDCYGMYLACRTKVCGSFRTQLWNVGAHLRLWRKNSIRKLKQTLKPAVTWLRKIAAGRQAA